MAEATGEYATKAEHAAFVSRVEAALGAHQEELKAREVSVPRALLTLAKDMDALRQGKRPDFPHSALQGALFAWLRPKWTIIVGSVIGAIVGAALTLVQVRLLSQQNDLIRQQGELLASQTRASELEAMSGVLAALASNDPKLSGLGIAQLSALGVTAYPVLIRLALADEESELRVLALQVLLQQGGSHASHEAEGTIVASAKFLESGTASMHESYSRYQDDLAQYLRELAFRGGQALSLRDSLVAKARFRGPPLARQLALHPAESTTTDPLSALWDLCHGHDLGSLFDHSKAFKLGRDALVKAAARVNQNPSSRSGQIAPDALDSASASFCGS